jgi:hypothetical protein
MPQLLLVILFIIYLVIGFKTPESVAMMIDSSVGKIVVALIALLLFAYSNPILGVLGVLGVNSCVYLPEKKLPPFLDCMPNGAATGAILTDAVAPTDALSNISRNLIL